MIPFLYENQYRFIPPLDDGIQPWYIIYTDGRIYSTKSNKYLSPIFVNGYYSVHLSTKTGSVCRKIHRLMMLTFAYFYGCEKYQVNHKDGIKSHNWIWNLEWSTPKENIQHAIENNLKPSFVGENNCMAKISEDQAKNIINYLIQGYSDYYISNMMNISISIIQNIARGNTWTYLTKDVMDILKRTRSGYKLTNNEYHAICKYYQDNINNYIKSYGMVKQIAIDALASIGVEINESTIRIAKRLYYRYDKKEINSLYIY